jgi:hypothetical protein
MLCGSCTAFDISRLLKEAHNDGGRGYTSFGDKLTEQALARNPQDFFAQHKDLEAVRESASSCDLCHAIWHDYCQYCTQPYTNPSSYQPDASSLVMRSEGSLGAGRIYITARPHSTSAVFRHDKSQVVVFRHGENQSFQILAWFDVFVEDHETVDTRDILLKPIAPDGGSTGWVCRAQEWLDDCLKNHKSCKTEIGPFALPTRVLEIFDLAADSTCSIRLVDGKGRVAPFAALSYSWEGESAQMLKADSLDRFRKGFSSSELPATMRDAVVVAKRMGLRYLWIDALCIFQDDAEDFARESAKMRDIYRGALFTINGSTAGKISDGLLSDRLRPSWTCALPWTNRDSTTAVVQLRSCNEMREVRVERSPINSRGWCLQENVLAQRTLWIGAPVHIFECTSGQVDEAGRSRESTERYRNKAHIGKIEREWRYARFRQLARFIGIPVVVHYQWPTFGNRLYSRPRAMLVRGAAVGSLQSNDTFWTYYDHWREIVLIYSRRQWSQQNDTLPALSGLAIHFYRALRDDYLAGIWKHDIVRGLNWNWMPHRNYKPPQSVIAPTWSWASVQPSQIFYWNCDWHDRVKILVKLLQHSITLTTADPFGRVEQAFIVMQGPFLLMPTPFPQIASSEDRLSLLGTVYEQQCSPEGNTEFHTRHKPHEGQKFGLLHLLNVERRPYGYMRGRTARSNDIDEHTNLLLLETCRDSHGWRRVGHIRFRLAQSEIDPTKSKSWRKEFYSHAWMRRDIHMV